MKKIVSCDVVFPLAVYHTLNVCSKLMGISYLTAGEAIKVHPPNGRKYVHEVLVNRFGGLSLARKSVVRLTDRPVMTIDVYRGRKTTIQQQQI